MRPQDIPLALLKGQIDCGICGLDCVVETELAQESPIDTRIQRLAELNFSRDTRDSARVILFGRPDSPPLSQNATVTISSEYPAITRNRYPNADIDFSHGSTEIKVAMRLFDYGVGVTITGISLRENGLQILDEIMVSPIVVIARSRISEFVALGGLMAGALRGRKSASHQIKRRQLSEKCSSGCVARPTRAHPQSVIGLRQRDRNRRAQITDGRASDSPAHAWARRTLLCRTSMRSWDNVGFSDGRAERRTRGGGKAGTAGAGRGKTGHSRSRADWRLCRRDDRAAPEPVEEIPPGQDQNPVRGPARSHIGDSFLPVKSKTDIRLYMNI